MGSLATGLRNWVQAMNRPKDMNRDQAVAAAFNAILEAWFAEPRAWDEADRYAAQILEAFARSDDERKPPV